MTDFEAGKTAYLAGKLASDNPYICGVTKLGAPKFSDADLGADWERGFISGAPVRKASKAEFDAAAQVDVSRFRRKSNRYYTR